MPRVKKISDHEVITAALEVLVEQGPAGFTLPAIGRGIGLSPAALLKRFGSKADLLELALDESTAQLQRALGEAKTTADPRADLLSWCSMLLPALAERNRLAAHLQLLARDVEDVRWRERAARHMALFRQGLSLRLKYLSSPEPDAHSVQLEALFHGLIVQWGVTGTGELGPWVERGVCEWLAGQAWYVERLFGSDQRHPLAIRIARLAL